jgi:hypothetical protein
MGHHPVLEKVGLLAEDIDEQELAFWKTHGAVMCRKLAGKGG